MVHRVGTPAVFAPESFTAVRLSPSVGHEPFSSDARLFGPLCLRGSGVVAPSASPGLDAKENSPAQVDERLMRVGHLRTSFDAFRVLSPCFNEILNLHNGDYGRSGVRRAGSMIGLAASITHLNASKTC